MKDEEDEDYKDSKQDQIELQLLLLKSDNTVNEYNMRKKSH